MDYGVAFAPEIRKWATLQVIGTTLLLHDYLLTLRDEVQCIWTRKFTGLTATFVVLRYAPLLYTALNAAVIPLSEQEARHPRYSLSILILVTAGISYAGLGAFCCLRVYAIAHKGKKLAALVAACMAVFLFLLLYGNLSEYRTCAYPLPYHWCNLTNQGSTIGVSAADVRIMGYIGMAFGLIGELIVQLTTWQSTFRIYKALQQLRGNCSLGRLILRDGTLVSCSLLLWFVISELAFQQMLLGLDPTVASIVVCRFIFRLRHVYLPANAASDTRGPGTTPSLIAGNMGAPLDVSFEHGEGEGDEYESEEVIISDRPLEVDLGLSGLDYCA